MRPPDFIRNLLWRKQFKKALKQRQIAKLGESCWLVLYDGRDAQHSQLARLVYQKQQATGCVLVGYEETEALTGSLALRAGELSQAKLPSPEILAEVRSKPYSLILLLAPKPEPCLLYLMAIVQSYRIVAVNPHKNNELYQLELSWPESNAQTAFERLYTQLKTYMRDVV